jgi:hypothetical protein
MVDFNASPFIPIQPIQIPLAPPVEASTANQYISSSDFDEVTYDHSMYKGIDADNPAHASVWLYFPSFAAGNTDDLTYNKNFGKFTSEMGKLKDDDFLYILPQNLISFTYDSFPKGAGEFTFQLYDPNYTEIETKIVKNLGHIAFQYGYSKNRTNASNLIFGKIIGYSLTPMLEGVFITFNGVSTGWALNIVKKPIQYSDDNIYKGLEKEPITISNFVNKLALDYGFTESWQRIIEPTEQIISRGIGLNSNNPTHIKFNATADKTCFQYIVETLTLTASSAEGNPGYYYFFVEQTVKGPILHFHTLLFKQKDDKGNPLKTTATKLFTIFKNKNTVVRDFAPDWSVSTANITGGARLAAIGYDPHNKVIITSEQAIKNVSDAIQGTPTNYVMVDNAPKISESLSIKSKEGVTSLYASGGTSVNELEKSLKIKFEEKVLQALQATLTIQGTHQLNMLQNIAVHWYIPKGNMKRNVLSQNQQIHWISGDFWIQGIKQHISKGDWQTILSLGAPGRRLLIESSVPTSSTKSSNDVAEKDYVGRA